MTYSTFEGQFTGRTISGVSQSFGLRQNDKSLIKGEYEVDGLAGATQSSMAVIEMMNTGLEAYKVYLELEKE